MATASRIDAATLSATCWETEEGVGAGAGGERGEEENGSAPREGEDTLAAEAAS